MLMMPELLNSKEAMIYTAVFLLSCSRENIVHDTDTAPDLADYFHPPIANVAYSNAFGLD